MKTLMSETNPIPNASMILPIDNPPGKPGVALELGLGAPIAQSSNALRRPKECSFIVGEARTRKFLLGAQKTLYTAALAAVTRKIR